MTIREQLESKYATPTQVNSSPTGSVREQLQAKYNPQIVEQQKSLGQKVMSGAQKVSDFFGGKGITDYLGAKIAKATVPEDAKQYVEEPTKKEVAGSVLQLGSTFTPIGRVARAVTKGASKLPQLSKVASKVGDITALGGAGYGFDVGANLQEGKTGADILTPGIGTGIGVGIPLAAPVVKAIGRGMRQGVGVSTGVGAGTLEETLKASMAGGKQARALREARRGEVSPEQIVEEARGALGQVKETRRTNYQNSIKQIAGDTTQYNTKPIIDEIKKGLDDFKVTVRNGELDFSRSPIRFNKQAQDDVKLIYDTMKGFGTRRGDRNAIGIDSLKQALGDLYTQSGQARAFVQRVKGKTREVLKDVKGYNEMADAYETSTNFVRELERGLSLGDKAQADTAFRKLTGALRTNNELRKQLIKELDEATGGTLSARIAGQQTSEVIPRGLAKFVSPGIATGVGFTGAIIPALMGLAVSSPRLVAGIIDALGVSLRKGKELKQLFGVIKSPGDVILESKPGKLAEKKATEYLKNPKLGLGMEDVSKTSNDLVAEARKYKSAEEFVKEVKQNPVYKNFTQDIIGTSKVQKGNLLNVPDSGRYAWRAGRDASVLIDNADLSDSAFRSIVGKTRTEVQKSLDDNLVKYQSEKTTAPPSDIKKIDAVVEYATKTKSQLTDIWNKANKLPEKPQSLSKITALMKKGSGEIKEAFEHPEIGKIDGVYGKGGEKGFGLAKIKEKHPEVFEKLDEIIKSAKIVDELEGRVKLETPDGKYRVIIDRNFGNEDKIWLMNAYEIK